MNQVSLAERLCEEGRVFLSLRKYQLAEKKYLEALVRDPQSTSALYGLGRSLYCQQRDDEAIVVWKKGLALEPLEEALYQGIVQAYLYQRDYSQALHYQQEWLQRSPTNPTVYFLKAHILLEMKEQNLTTAEESLFEAAIQAKKLMPDRPETAALLGQVWWLVKGDKLRAIEELTQAVTLKPEEEYYHFVFGKLLLAMGERQWARDELKLALKINPSREGIVRQLREVNKALHPLYSWVYWLELRMRKVPENQPVLVFILVLSIILFPLTIVLIVFWGLYKTAVQLYLNDKL
jgi:tetratricopeptide (TPR) repeat protein